MKKIIVYLLAVIVISTTLFSSTGKEVDSFNFKKWERENPTSLPHVMTPEEEKRKDEIGRDFYETDPPVGTPRNIAEFEPMEGVLVRYPFGISISIIAEMAEDTKVVTLVSSSSQQSTVTSQYNSAGVNMSNIDFLIAPTDSYWTRDYGPWYIAVDNQDVSVVNFKYNRPRPGDDDVPIEMSTYLGVDLYGMNIVATGGNYMTDGMGISASTTIIYTESAAQGISNAQVDERMLDYLGINTYHVLEDPNNTYIDHIDCWGKFLDVDKILLREVPVSHPQYDEIESVVTYFESQTSSYNTPYEIYRVNTPNNEPYTNSLILNNKVLVPILGASNDAAALQVYEEAMPGYEIIGFTGSWESTDALHCRTKGIADREMVYIKHIAKSGDQPIGEYVIDADIYSYAGYNLNSDELKLNYSINGGAFTAIVMAESKNGTYTAIIPEQAEGSEIKYYISAQDEFGKSAAHPYIGEADPHSFSAGSAYFANIVVDTDEIMLLAYNNITSEEVNISNTGQLELNYTVEAETFDSESYDYSISNSPSGSSYSSNTYTENSWTDLQVDLEGEIAGFSIEYTWGTDNWPAEGSFMAESPEGTVSTIASGSTNGTYTTDLSSFNGESINGNWKIWIEDSYGDGGHQATNITLTLSKSLDIDPWLSVSYDSSSLSPGANENLIVIGTFVNGMEPGITYYGNVKIISNDPDSPEINIPVEYEMEVGIDNNYELGITNYELKQNYPNPFNPITKINYELGITNYELAEIVVYNAAGQQVWSSPVTRYGSPVTGFILFNGSSFNSGIYYYALVIDGKKMETKAMVLIK